MGKTPKITKKTPNRQIFPESAKYRMVNPRLLMQNRYSAL
jgi:hypothetical protein